jgi:hypothetical protein
VHCWIRLVGFLKHQHNHNNYYWYACSWKTQEITTKGKGRSVEIRREGLNVKIKYFPWNSIYFPCNTIFTFILHALYNWSHCIYLLKQKQVISILSEKTWQTHQCCISLEYNILQNEQRTNDDYIMISFN